MYNDPRATATIRGVGIRYVFDDILCWGGFGGSANGATKPIEGNKEGTN
jgi:hypothetical protein